MINEDALQRILNDELKLQDFGRLLKGVKGLEADIHQLVKIVTKKVKETKNYIKDERKWEVNDRPQAMDASRTDFQTKKMKIEWRCGMFDLEL